MDETNTVAFPEKPYTFRKLAAEDLFPMAKLISKIGINQFISAFDSPAIKSLISKVSQKAKAKDAKADDADAGAKVAPAAKDAPVDEGDDFSFIIGAGVALEIANVIFKNLSSCQAEIYTLLANVSDMTKDEIKRLDLDVFLMMIVDFIKKEEFKSFFKVALTLFK